MNIVYGTTNESKFSHMKDSLNGLNINISKLENKMNIIVEEIGNKPLENARVKARAYYKQLNKPVFSCDSGLYIDNIDESKQPGVYVRRINGKELNDEEMIAYYSNLAKANGGSMVARYRNAICLIIDENNIYEYEGDDICSGAFLIMDKAHKSREVGFPLDSLSAEVKSKRYYFDIKEQEKNENLVRRGFRNFFIRVLEDYNMKK